MIFLRLSAGFLLQVIPFAVLALYPYCEQLRFSKKRSILLTLWLLLGLSALFAGCGCYLRFLLPPDHTLFQAVNVVFLLCILPCLGWYLYLVPGIWQKKAVRLFLRPHRRAGHQLHQQCHLHPVRLACAL